MRYTFRKLRKYRISKRNKTHKKRKQPKKGGARFKIKAFDNCLRNLTDCFDTLYGRKHEPGTAWIQVHEQIKPEDISNMTNAVKIGLQNIDGYDADIIYFAIIYVYFLFNILPRLNIYIEGINDIDCHKIYFKNKEYRNKAFILLDEIISSDVPWANEIKNIYGISMFMPDENCEGHIDSISYEPIKSGNGFRLLDDGVDDDGKLGKCYDIDTLLNIRDKKCPYTRIDFTDDVNARIKSYELMNKYKFTDYMS